MAKSPEERRASARAASIRWHKNHPEKSKALKKAFYDAHPGYATAAVRKWQSNNQEKVAAAARRRLYGLTDEQFGVLVKRAGNRCELCGYEFTESPCVDHDHESNRVRGLLCNRCNRGLGLLGDDLEKIKERIMRYLQRQG